MGGGQWCGGDAERPRQSVETTKVSVSVSESLKRRRDDEWLDYLKISTQRKAMLKDVYLRYFKLGLT